MSTLGRFLLFALLLVVSCPALTGQVRKKIPVPQIDRQWEETKDGLWEWKKYDHKCDHCKTAKTRTCEYCEGADWVKCQACKGKKVATCRLCAGAGKLADPLVSMMCPYCDGMNWHPCGLCHGKGSFPVKGGGKKEQACSACKKAGSHACKACKGKHHILVVKVGKKGIGNASSKDLKKARKVLQKALDEVTKLKFTSNESKSLKLFKAPLKKPAKILPVLKDMEKLLVTSLKGLRKGSSYVAYPEWVLAEFHHFQDKTIYLLRYQILLIDICLKRAEHNEAIEAKLEAEKKKD